MTLATQPGYTANRWEKARTKNATESFLRCFRRPKCWAERWTLKRCLETFCMPAAIALASALYTNAYLPSPKSALEKLERQTGRMSIGASGLKIPSTKVGIEQDARGLPNRHRRERPTPKRERACARPPTRTPTEEPRRGKTQPARSFFTTCSLSRFRWNF